MMRRNDLDGYKKEKRERKAAKRKGLYAAGALLVVASFAGGAIAGSALAPLSVAAESSLPGYESAETEETLSETAIDSTSVSTVTTLPDVSAIVEQSMRSVVAITNTIELTTTTNYNFNWYGYGQNNNGQTETRETEAYGSGVIIGENDTELLIATNNHVAVYDESGTSSFYEYSGSTKSLTVTFADGSEHEAHLKGADSDADLAVIAVDLEDLNDETKSAISIATLGDSDEAKVGQGVIAIGNALGLGQTTTIGYISALNREVTTEDGVTRTLMQVDAAINGGNSGGGLFNSKGELIGINSAKYSAVGVEGIGYAIPISTASEILDELKVKTTKVALEEDERGYLGIIGDDVNSAYVSYGYPAGAQILQITEASPAEEAGLQRGDIITEVNGEKISSYAELRTQLGYYAPGETVELTIQRVNGNTFEEISVSVTLSARDSIIQ